MVQLFDEPVTISLQAVRTSGNLRATLVVDIRPGYHLYAPESDEGVPFSVEIPDGSALSLAEPPTFPASSGRLYGSFEVEMTLDGDGREVELLVGYQACDPEVCLMPAKESVRCAVSEVEVRRD